MKFDATRPSFRPLKHFSRVLSQQGRVMLDADCNEQTAILTSLLRGLAADIIGQHGGPDDGFTLGPVATDAPVPDDLQISPGRYYVDGILCVLEASPVPVTGFATDNAHKVGVPAWTVDGMPFRRGEYVALGTPDAFPHITSRIADVDYPSLALTLDADLSALHDRNGVVLRRVPTYRSQPDLIGLPGLGAGQQQLYLDVWERLITSLEDDSIREIALNGPDTTARAKIVWQVKAMGWDSQDCMTSVQLRDRFQPANRGLLRARTLPAQVTEDPCTIAPSSAYRGPENQLYRVEVHVGSDDPAGRPSFKWSRENGSVVFPIVALSAGDGSATVVLDTLGRDDRFGLAEGDVVEVQDDAVVLANMSGPLLVVQSIDRGASTIVLAGAVAAGIGSDATRHPLLRRWDQKARTEAPLGPDNAVPIPRAATTAGGPIALQRDVWLDLEDGVQVQFVTAGAPQYRPADYWLIPARVVSGDVIWASEVFTDTQGKTVRNPVAMPPDGVEHSYAPLAIVTVSGTAAPIVATCRLDIEAIAKPMATLRRPTRNR